MGNHLPIGDGGNNNNNGGVGGSGAPKSFYLVLGGPSIRYNRPGRGPLIFDVEPMTTSVDELVEHAEVVRPSVNVSTKQRFQLIPSSAPNAGTAYPPKIHWSFRLKFQMEYTAAPQRVEVFVDTAIEYRAGEGIILLPRGSCRPAAPDASSATTATSTSTPTRVLLKESFSGISSSGPLDMLSYCSDFVLDTLVPALPKEQLTEPCSLKECPIVIVVQFEAVPAQQSRPAAATTTTSAAASNTTPTPGSFAAAAAANTNNAEADTVSEVTATHRLYTFLTYDQKLAQSMFPSPTKGQSKGDHNGDTELGELRHLEATVVKQYLEFNGEVYELDDIFDLGGDEPQPIQSPVDGSPREDSPTNVDDGARGDDEEDNCVICLCNPKDTTIIPCRHLCLCAECAVHLKHQSNKCPICRRPIERLMTR